MREKQQGNPEYAFLYGGEHSAYYQWALHAARSGWSPEAADAQAASYFQQHGAPTTSAPLTPQEESQIQSILGSLTRSKESIRVSKEWIMSHCHNGDAIAAQMLRAVGRSSSFDQKLNLVYLLSDVMFNCPTTPGTRENGLRQALDQRLVSILREATHGYQPAEQEKVFKVIDLWKERQVLSPAMISSINAGLANTPPAAPTAQASKPATASGGSSSFSSGCRAAGAPASKFTSTPEPAEVPPNRLPIGLLVSQYLNDRDRKPYTPISKNRLPRDVPAPRGPSREIEDALKRFDAKQAPPLLEADRARSDDRHRDDRRGDRRSREREHRSRSADRRRDDDRRRDRSPPRRDRSPPRRDRSPPRRERSPPRRHDDRGYDRRDDRDRGRYNEGPRMGGGPDRGGLGHLPPSGGQDEFDAFRKRTSSTYHVTGRTGQVVDSYSAREEMAKYDQVPGDRDRRR